MQLPLATFTDFIPSELTLTATVGIQGNAPSAYEFRPYLHDAIVGIQGGFPAGITHTSINTMVAGIQGKHVPTLLFLHPTDYTWDAIVRAKGGMATTWFFEGTVTIGIQGGASNTVVFENGPVLAADLPSPLTSSFDPYTDDNDLVGRIFNVLQFSGSASMGSSSALSAELPLLTTTLHKAGELEADLTSLTGAFTASVPIVGALDAELTSLAATSWAALNPTIGYLAGELTLPSAALVSAQGQAGTLAASLPKPTSQLSGLMGATGALAGELTTIAAVFTGYGGITATLLAVLPKLTGTFVSTQTPVYLTTYVVNLANSALTAFSNYGFTSVAEFAGGFYAVKSDGIYLLDGALDQTTPISATVELGNLDFGNRNQKRVSDFYMAYNTDGKVNVTVSTDETTPYTYQMLSYGVQEIRQRRVLLGKGMRGKYWKIKFDNVDGADMKIESLHLRVAPLTRRI